MTTDAAFNMVTAMATSQIRGFMLNIRSLFVAVFLLLLFWILLLLTKYVVNAIRPVNRTATMYDTYSGRGGMAGAGVSNGGAAGGVVSTGGKRSKWMPRWTSGPMVLPPPPTPTIPGTAFGGAGGMMNGGAGAMNGGAGAVGRRGMAGEAADKAMVDRYWSHGVESERGYPGETPFSVALSRAADVVRLGYLFLLGGTLVNALSFGAKAVAQVLGWIFTALVLLWMVLALVTPSRWVPLILGLISLPILIAIWSVGFQVDRSSGPLFEGL